MKRNYYGSVVEKLDMNAIEKFAQDIFYCDPYTAMHAERVADLMAGLASQLYSSSDLIGQAYIAGLVHDVGKVKIPMDILIKTERLTNEEYAIIKNHAVYGANMLATVKGAEPIIPILRHHHEWFNGKGYPDGLKGNAIPLLSRMLTICDSFDAMTTQRCYRKPISLPETLLEIKRCAGAQFDPELCNAFIEFLGIRFSFDSHTAV